MQVARNSIKELPSTMNQLSNLEMIDLDGNSISSLGPIGQLARLATLNANSNAIVSLDDLDFSKMKGIRTLSANRNKIEEIPDTIGDATYLINLSLESNAIETLPKSIVQLKK